MYNRKDENKYGPSLKKTHTLSIPIFLLKRVKGTAMMAPGAQVGHIKKWITVDVVDVSLALTQPLSYFWCHYLSESITDSLKAQIRSKKKKTDIWKFTFFLPLSRNRNWELKLIASCTFERISMFFWNFFKTFWFWPEKALSMELLS